ncbi:uncharacterized protein LOC128960802 [Oppia nitens]|uniref:uncharacterized protein LOC128960802 n=1 Tax=Oppia nitens TaxID=1686743 RepID=UPI0023D9B981|nr:uncharacterized protein LOC128960802 [Oppia nitens]
MIVMSVINCFVITIIIDITCLSSIVSSNDSAVHSLRDSGQQSYVSASSSNSHPIGGGGIGGGSANIYPPSAARMTSESVPVEQGSCVSKTDCHSAHTYCDSRTHRCRCSGDYIHVVKYVNNTRTKPLSLVCLQVAKLDDRCHSHEQCVVANSMCIFADPVGVVGFRNVSSNYCKCREGYHAEDKEETFVTKDNQRISARRICGEFLSIGNSWIGTFAIICIMLLIIIIGCFVGIVRFQRWKQRPLASTVTSLAADNRHTPHLISSSPPPMGSVEAEFQNDFIQVFPMHHLEPLPDKNTSNYEFVIK